MYYKLVAAVLSNVFPLYVLSINNLKTKILSYQLSNAIDIIFRSIISLSKHCVILIIVVID